MAQLDRWLACLALTLGVGLSQAAAAYTEEGFSLTNPSWSPVPDPDTETLWFYDSTIGPGQTRIVDLNTTGLFDLDYDVSRATGEGILGFSELALLPLGGVIFDVFACEAANCQFRYWPGGEGTGRLWISGGHFEGEGAGSGGFPETVYDLGKLGATFTGEGAIAVLGCNYTDASFGTKTCFSFALVATAGWTPPAPPEPPEPAPSQTAPPTEPGEPYERLFACANLDCTAFLVEGELVTLHERFSGRVAFSAFVDAQASFPAPEPGSGLLFAGGLLALARLSRARCSLSSGPLDRGISPSSLGSQYAKDPILDLPAFVDVPLASAMRQSGLTRETSGDPPHTP